MGTGATAVPCPAGTYQPNTGRTSIDACLPCPEGYYCRAAAATYLLCPAGSYCLANTPGQATTPFVPTMCPPGTHTNGVSGLTNSDGCIGCPPGYYCPQGSATPTICPAGTYQPHHNVTTLGSCLPCVVRSSPTNRGDRCGR